MEKKGSLGKSQACEDSLLRFRESWIYEIELQLISRVVEFRLVEIG